jgi:site-specific DNA recombinase
MNTRSSAALSTVDPLRALIYTRVSKDPKARGRSTREQETECREVCDDEGWDVIDVVTDNHRSASRYAKRDREGWGNVKELLSTGRVDVLVTWEASRTGRDLDAYVELRNLCEANGVLWSYSGETYDLAKRSDRKRTAMDAIDAEDEAERSRERILRSTRAQAVSGKPHGRRLYGYDRQYDSTTGELVNNVADPAEAAIVVEVARRFAGGESAYSICVDLNRRGIPTGTGSEWRGDQIKRMLTNPAYVGDRVHQGEIVGPASWAAILEQDVFDICQVRYADPARTTNRDKRDLRHLLTGIARCGKCGARMYRGHDRKHRDIYSCKAGLHLARDMKQVDAYVISHVLDLLSRDVHDLVIADEPDGEDHRVVIVELRRRLDDAYATFSAGGLTAAGLGRVEADLLARIAAAEREARRAVPVPAIVFDIAGPDVEARWDALLIEERRTVVKAVVDITILPVQTTGRHVFDPDGVRVVPRLGQV